METGLVSNVLSVIVLALTIYALYHITKKGVRAFERTSKDLITTLGLIVFGLLVIILILNFQTVREWISNLIGSGKSAAEIYMWRSYLPFLTDNLT
jgi:hypothetical protein